MSLIIEQSPQRPAALGERVRNSVGQALSRAVLVETVAAYALLEWVNFLDEGWDEIQELRERQLLAQRSEGDCSTHQTPASRLPSTESVEQQARVIDWGLQEYAQVVQYTLGNCYQSYMELTEILDACKNPRDVKSKPPTTSP